MKSLLAVYLLLLAASLSSVLSEPPAGSSSHRVFLPGRLPRADPSQSPPNPQQHPQKFQVRGIRIVKAGSMATGISRGHEDSEELTYHTDYHGVTTHPTPYPKHPNP
ncbi:uncharacterized protein LOC127794469 [Diospyros lotus]|uniref:uncharacterized protein LOC127794469 n=1 Tax=Diospyros lotus TaxID=55363 RepID=UPI00225A6D5A|nr:uncharacterized protein LOC127794469 [Diospyros lotus]